MKIAFYTSIPLEIGVGCKKYYITISAKLTKLFPNTQISIISLSNPLFSKIQFIISLYYFKIFYYKKKTMTVKKNKL